MIVGLGEVLWDLLPSGPQMGGAPANFACHAQALGAEARVISRVGTDDLGRELVTRLGARGVWTDCVQTDALHPTGTVTVEVAADGQPRYVIHEGAAWDFLEATPCARAAVAVAEAVCFGTLAQRSAASRAALRALLAAAAPDALRVCDVNLRQHYFSRELLAESLALANVVKLNDTELPVLAQLFDLPGDSRAQLAALLERHALRLIVCTRGAHGSLLHDGHAWAEHAGLRAAVVDTIGAGDSFTAATVLGVLAGWPLERTSTLANQVAAYVCGHHGATPEMPADLRAAFAR